MTNYIAYYRLSPKEPREKLQDQRQIVHSYINPQNVVMSFEEIETTQNTTRPKLKMAIELCIHSEYALVVSHIDRLGKSSYHLTQIRENLIRHGQFDLLVVKKPQMSYCAFSLYVDMINEESKKISLGTRTALKLQRQSCNIVKSNLTNEAREKGCKHKRQKAQLINRKAYQQARVMRSEGKSYRFIAHRLNELGIRTSRGIQFYATSVKNLLELYK